MLKCNKVINKSVYNTFQYVFQSLEPMKYLGRLLINSSVRYPEEAESVLLAVWTLHV